MSEKCFCHIVDKNGNKYEVKDAYARSEMQKIEGKVDGRLAVFDEYAGTTLDQMNELNSEIAEGINDINKNKKEAIATVRTSANAAIIDINKGKEDIASALEEATSAKNDIIAIKDSVTSEIGSARTDLYNEYADYKKELENKTDALLDGLIAKYGDLASSAVTERINLFTSATDKRYFADGELTLEIPANFSRLTLFINICFSENGVNCYYRKPFIIYPSRFYASTGAITSSSNNAVIFYTREFYRQLYHFDLEIRQTGAGIANNINTLRVNFHGAVESAYQGSTSSFTYGYIDGHIVEVD